jgi:RNA 2',3'-cyclic 3'-phosphodiesterase
MAERTARLFVGIDLDSVWTAGLTDELRAVTGDRARYVKPELLHVTVVFLGDQDAEGQELAGKAVRAAATSSRPFELTLVDIRRLGGHEHGALVAAVDDPSGGLRQLRARLDRELRQYGVHFDSKPLVPHITLARPKRRSGPLPIAPLDLSDAPPLAVGHVSLVRSYLLPTGPKYESLAKQRLGGQ